MTKLGILEITLKDRIREEEILGYGIITYVITAICPGFQNKDPSWSPKEHGEPVWLPPPWSWGLGPLCLRTLTQTS